MATKAEQLAKALEIKNETANDANTATRVGTLFEDIVESNYTSRDADDNNRPEWDNGTELKGLAYKDEIPVVANTAIKNQQYNYPDWFTGFKIPISVLNGNITHNFDVTRYVENKIGGRFEDVLSVRYVSPSGNNSNDGLTPANAKLTVQNAISDGGELIYLLPGTYLRDSFLSGNLSLTGGQKVFIIGIGDVFITNAQGGLSWTLDSDDTYSATRSGVADVIDKAFNNSDGYPLEYPLVGDLATCKATPGSWFQSGSTLYVHCLDGRSPDSSVLPEIVITNNVSGTDGIFYLENVVFARVPWTITGDNSSAELFVYMKSVTKPYTNFDAFSSSRHNGFYTNSFVECILQKCVTLNDKRDGFNYHDTQTVGDSKALEIDCFASNPGTDDANTNNQCSTAHSAIRITRINGSYFGGKNTTIADVNAGIQSVLIGCEINAGKADTTWALILADADVFACKIYGDKLIGEVDESQGGITVRNSILEISGTTGEVTIET